MCTCLAAEKLNLLCLTSDARVPALVTMYRGCISGGNDSSCFLWILHDFTLFLALQEEHSCPAAAMGTRVRIATFVFYSQTTLFVTRFPVLGGRSYASRLAVTFRNCAVNG